MLIIRRQMNTKRLTIQPQPQILLRLQLRIIQIKYHRVDYIITLRKSLSLELVNNNYIYLFVINE
jgi:hypothetical protein